MLGSSNSLSCTRASAEISSRQPKLHSDLSHALAASRMLTKRVRRDRIIARCLRTCFLWTRTSASTVLYSEVAESSRTQYFLTHNVALLRRSISVVHFFLSSDMDSVRKSRTVQTRPVLTCMQTPMSGDNPSRVRTALGATDASNASSLRGFHGPRDASKVASLA